MTEVLGRQDHPAKLDDGWLSPAVVGPRDTAAFRYDGDLPRRPVRDR